MAVKDPRPKNKRRKPWSKLSPSYKAKLLHQQVMKKTKPGSGKRFKSLVKQLKKRKGIKNPAALAAYIGRKKYGKARFQRMALAGRKRK